MNIKIIFKVSVLLFGLVMVIFASKYFASQPFQNSLDQVFQTGSQFQWCRPEASLSWLDQVMVDKTKSWKQDAVAQKYCTVQMESIQGIDLKTAAWSQLAQGFDTKGKAVYLEWDRDLKVFRVAGLPFKSSVLFKDITE